MKHLRSMKLCPLCGWDREAAKAHAPVTRSVRRGSQLSQAEGAPGLFQPDQDRRYDYDDWRDGPYR